MHTGLEMRLDFQSQLMGTPEELGLVSVAQNGHDQQP